MNLPSVVLGIDPGVSRCGYGAVVADGSSLSALAYGVIRTPPGDPLPDRLAAIQVELEGLLAELRPAAVAVERVFFQTNVRTAMSVGPGQRAGPGRRRPGRRARLPVHAERGEAGGGRLRRRRQGPGAGHGDPAPAPDEVPKPPDAADALALAICHLSAGRFRAAAGAGGAMRTFDGSSPPPASGLARAIAAATQKAPPRKSHRKRNRRSRSKGSS